MVHGAVGGLGLTRVVVMAVVIVAVVIVAVAMIMVIRSTFGLRIVAANLRGGFFTCSRLIALDHRLGQIGGGVIIQIDNIHA